MIDERITRLYKLVPNWWFQLNLYWQSAFLFMNSWPVLLSLLMVSFESLFTMLSSIPASISLLLSEEMEILKDHFLDGLLLRGSEEHFQNLTPTWVLYPILQFHHYNLLPSPTLSSLVTSTSWSLLLSPRMKI